MFSQGYVVKAVQEDTTSDNQFEGLLLTSIFNIIKGALMDSDSVELPTDIHKVLIVLLRQLKVSMQTIQHPAGHEENVLDSNERAAIDTHGLFNLNDYLQVTQMKKNLV